MFYFRVVSVFAPTNEAFSAVNSVTFDFLQSAAGELTLNSILSFHIAPGTYNSASLLSKENSNIASLYAEGVAMIMVSTSDDGAVVLNGDTGVVRGDVVSNNGILHVINQVMSLPVITGPPSVETPPSPPDTSTTSSPVSASFVFRPSLWTGWLGWLSTTLLALAC